MDALTIHEAAVTTGWSARMLRYVERAGLIEPHRSDAGYRLYGPEELQRLRTLRALLEEHELGITDVAFALRMRRDEGLTTALSGWFTAEPARPTDVPEADWLNWEQNKHQKLLAAATRHATELMETR